MSPSQPSNPFIDDYLTPPPVALPTSQARASRTTAAGGGESVLCRSKAEETPRTISVASARPLKTVRNVAVVRANNVTDNGEQVPENPLRK